MHADLLNGVVIIFHDNIFLLYLELDSSKGLNTDLAIFYQALYSEAEIISLIFIPSHNIQSSISST